jgi:hypothetical protein
MATIVEQFKAILGVDVEPGTQKSLEDIESSLDDVISGFGAMAAAAGAAVAGLVAATAVTNKHTAVQTNMAKSLGISAGALENYGFLLGEIGLDQSVIEKSLKVINDRMGDLAQGSKAPETLTRAMKNLNLEFKDLKDLAPQHQLQAILDASQNAADGQLAMSSATELMGRDAVKLVGWLREQDSSIVDLLINQAKMNLQTEEGRQGAVRMTSAMDNLGAVTESTWKLFSGLVGETLSPIIEAFNAWVAANRELIQTKIKEWAEGFGKLVAWLIPRVKSVIRVVVDLWKTIDRFVTKTIGWSRLLRILGAAFAAMLAILAVATVLKMAIALQKMAVALKVLWAAALRPLVILGLIFLVLEDIYGFLEGKESVTGDLLKMAEEWLGIELIKPIRTAWPAVKKFLVDMGSLFAKYLTGLIQTVTGFIKFNIDIIGNLVRFIVDIFDKGIGVAWDNLVRRMTEAWHEFSTGLFGTWKEAIDKVILYMDPLLKKIESAAKFFGLDIDIGKSISGFTSGFVSDSDRFAGRTAAAGAVTNNTGGGVAVTNNINVTQQPGESGTGLADRVLKIVGTEVAGAVRSNSTGVQY